MRKSIISLMLVMSCASMAATETFSSRLFQLVAKDKPNANFVFSGESLKTVLLMLQDGATGDTQRELSQALCGSSALCQSEVPNKQQGYQAANAMWVQQGLAINPNYRSQIIRQYHGEVASVDFLTGKEQAVKKINAWADKSTQGMIPDLLKTSDIESNTALILTNAIYFQGFWPELFDIKKTTDRPFTLLNGSKIEVPTMIKEADYLTAKQNNIQLVGLPYRDSSLELLILMPEDPKKFAEFASNLTSDTIEGLVKAQQKHKFTLYLPKFSIASSYGDLKPSLQKLGIRKVFTTAAELNKINAKAPLLLSKVLQKAIIKVDERGTKAAAVTAGIVMMRAVMPMMTEINRPFVFVIFDQKSNKPIFMGQVVNPVR